MRAKLTVLGVRGALPAVGRPYLEYGGNTSCMALEWGGGTVCFDAGTGLAALPPVHGRLDILISHVHLDHILGLVSLPGLGAEEVHLYGEARQGRSFRRQLEAVIGRPYWPVGLKDWPVEVHEIAPGDVFTLPSDGGDVRVSAMRGNHPDGSLLYRAEFGGVSVSYTLDCEMGGGETGWSSRLAEFVRGSSLLIWDANFTQADKRPGWGHSTWEEGLTLGRAAGADRIMMTHYAREYTDEFLAEQEKLARRKDGTCMFAKEGMALDL